MTTPALGRLEPVFLRDVWPSEADDFTPWLAEPQNISILGETIGLELEVEATEKDVGPFRADILCKDLATDGWVLIENQLERTDHTHLGQLLTYAAGLQVVTIVWIAQRFTEEHRAALDWLNEITDERFNFFGLEIELWRIGPSPVAPKFNVVCKPNDWTKTVASGAAAIAKQSLSETQQLQVDFWTTFRAFAGGRGSVIRPTKPFPQNWMTIGFGRNGFKLGAVASTYDSEAGTRDTGEVRAEVLIDNDDAKAYFALLLAQQPAIELDVGGPLHWHNPSDKKQCKVYFRRSVLLTDRGQWPDYQDWLLTKLEILHRVFGPRVRTLDLNGPEGA